MAKLIPDAVLDVALTDIKTNVDEVHLCAGQPADHTDVAAHSLGHVHVDTDDFTIADGDTSGRKVTLAAQTIPADANGDADHVVCVDAGTAIKAITTITTKTLASGTNYDIAAVDLWEIRDPS
jgi:hypothetical protein